MRKAGYLLVLVSCFGFFSCIKQAPQLPSNKGVEFDTKSASLLIINQNLAKKEDIILANFASKKGGFTKSELGFWYKIDNMGKGIQIKDSSVCKFEFKMTLLDGKELQVGKQQIIIGKKQTIIGLEEGLKLMHKGDEATLIIPWYLGYGMKGLEHKVPSYTSILYNIKILK
jgi:FKBP-type peptidyl-prolyl cis-trans isomerase FkpA